MNPAKAIPSMFHRRLLLLLSVCVVMLVGLGMQMIRLSVVEGAERLAAAEARLDVRTYLPTQRGRILDRYGRVLAMDRASCDIAVEYSVITGTWVRTQARRFTIEQMGRTKWNAISPEQRQLAVAEALPQFTEQRERLWRDICRIGQITDADLQHRLDDIKATVQSAAATYWERQRLREEVEYGVRADEFKPLPIREQQQAHVVLPQVSDEVAFAFRKLDQEMPNMIAVRNSSRREYPWSSASVTLSRAGLPRPIRNETAAAVHVVGVADHIVGSMRSRLWESDVKRRPQRDPITGAIDLGWYQPGDSVGARGIERVCEDQLRGLRGEIRERKDTGEQLRTPAQPGQDVQLTLDVALQARVQAILSPEFGLTRVQSWQKNAALPLGTPLNAAAVIIEIQTGEILAMVSMPTLAMGELMSDEQRQFSQPIVNRAVEAVYPPGSILKPLVLAAAVKEGLMDLNAAITCTGHYFPERKDTARCWIYREQFGMQTHGPLRAPEALARSCNMYFYTLGDRLGMERQVKWFHRFGLGQPLDIGLLYAEEGRFLGENGGALPSEENMRAIRNAREMRYSEVIMGIGQGRITWTPVQAANAYAMMARGGTVRDATLIMTQRLSPRAKRSDDVQLSSPLVATILEGLRQAAMEHHGTGHHISYGPGDEEPIINASGVHVWAKTGTAQADRARGLDHSWFVGMAGPKDTAAPMFAIAVLVENGGSGGRTAGPIANQIIRALQAEGYLPGDADARPTPAPVSWPPQPEPDEE